MSEEADRELEEIDAQADRIGINGDEIFDLMIQAVGFELPPAQVGESRPVFFFKDRRFTVYYPHKCPLHSLFFCPICAGDGRARPMTFLENLRSTWKRLVSPVSAASPNDE